MISGNVPLIPLLSGFMMVVYLGRTAGTALLRSEVRDLGEVRHDLRVYEDAVRGLTAAGGRLSAHSTILRQASPGQRLTLVFEDQAAVELVVEYAAPQDGYVIVATDQPVPGFHFLRRRANSLKPPGENSFHPRRE